MSMGFHFCPLRVGSDTGGPICGAGAEAKEATIRGFQQNQPGNRGQESKETGDKGTRVSATGALEEASDDMKESTAPRRVVGGLLTPGSAPKKGSSNDGSNALLTDKKSVRAPVSGGPSLSPTGPPLDQSDTKKQSDVVASNTTELRSSSSVAAEKTTNIFGDDLPLKDSLAKDLCDLLKGHDMCGEAIVKKNCAASCKTLGMEATNLSGGSALLSME